MKYYILLIMLLPMALALYGGESYTYHLDQCDNATVTINANQSEWTILNCTETSLGQYQCNCTNNYNMIFQSKPNVIGTYNINISYSYTTSAQNGRSGGGGGGSSKRVNTTITLPLVKPKFNISDVIQKQPSSKPKVEPSKPQPEPIISPRNNDTKILNNTGVLEEENESNNQYLVWGIAFSIVFIIFVLLIYFIFIRKKQIDY